MGLFSRKRKQGHIEDERELLVARYRAGIATFLPEATELRTSNQALWDRLSDEVFTSPEIDREAAIVAAGSNPNAYVALGMAEATKSAGLADGTLPRGEAPRGSDDPQRDEIYDGMINLLGGTDQVIATIMLHAQASGRTIDAEDAARVLEEWRLRGIVNNLSLGEYLDRRGA